MPVVLYPAEAGLGQGSTGEIVRGTGTSVPGGVESTFEFNGLLMNVRNWIDTFLVTDIDGLDDADVRDARQSNPNTHGETPFDSYYGGRTITLSGKIRAHTLFKLRDMQTAMRQAFADLQEHPLVIRSGKPELEVMIWAKKYQKLTIREAQTNFKHERDFQVALRASQPFFQSYNEVYIPIALPTSPQSTVITNLGNFDSAPRFVIVGPITNPVITNTTTGKQMTFNGVLAAGDLLTVDVFRKTITDANGANKFSMLDVTSDWVTLQPGDNAIQITGTGLVAGSAIQIFHKHTWL